MLFLAPTLDNADPLVALIVTPCSHLHDVDVADEDLASGSLYGDCLTILPLRVCASAYMLVHGSVSVCFVLNL